MAQLTTPHPLIGNLAAAYKVLNPIATDRQALVYGQRTCASVCQILNNIRTDPNVTPPIFHNADDVEVFFKRWNLGYPAIDISAIKNSLERLVTNYHNNNQWASVPPPTAKLLADNLRVIEKMPEPLLHAPAASHATTAPITPLADRTSPAISAMHAQHYTVPAASGAGSAYIASLRRELIGQFFKERIRPKNPGIPTADAIKIAQNHAGNTIDVIYDVLMCRENDPALAAEAVRSLIDGNRSVHTGTINLEGLQKQLLHIAQDTVTVGKGNTNPHRADLYKVHNRKIHKAIAAMHGDSTPTPQAQSITHQGHGIVSPLLDATTSLPCR